MMQMNFNHLYISHIFTPFSGIVVFIPKLTERMSR